MAKLTESVADEFPVNAYTNDEFPSFKGMGVCVLPGAFHSSIEDMFGSCKASLVSVADAKNADIVVFSGGADVDPSTYGQVAIPETYGAKARDLREKEIFDLCIEHETTMFGICRGLQALHAFQGGTLWQDVTNHGRHHTIYDIEFLTRVSATSIHHQMVKNDVPDMRIVAIANKPVSEIAGPNGVSTHFKDATGIVRPDWNDTFKMNGRLYYGEIPEIEAVIYEKTGIFGVQGHPEVDGSKVYASWCLHVLKDFVELG